MDYTEEQKEQFKREFARKRHRQVVLAVALVLLLVLLLGGSSRGDAPPLFHVPAAVTYVALMAIAGGLIFSFRNWRCPACGKYLGKSIGQCECPRCGIELRSPASPVEYSEERSAELQRQFAARERRQSITFMSVLSALLLFVTARAIGVSAISLALLFAGVLLVLGAVVFSLVNWRCPGCGKYLGQIPIRRHCPKCGLALHSS